MWDIFSEGYGLLVLYVSVLLRFSFDFFLHGDFLTSNVLDVDLNIRFYEYS